MNKQQKQNLASLYGHVNKRIAIIAPDGDLSFRETPDAYLMEQLVEILKFELAKTESLEALCLNALYHHQGASSAVGQPIRKALGIGEYDSLTETQLKIIHNVRAPYAAIAKENQANQWQPIETASGRTVILGFVPHQIGGYVCPIVRDKEGRWANTSCASFSEVNPTHWMLLPKNPSMQPKEQAK